MSAAYHPHSPLPPAVQETGPDGAPTSKADAVLWTFVFDPRLGCNHINLIDRHDGTLGGDANQVTPLELRHPTSETFSSHTEPRTTYNHGTIGSIGAGARVLPRDLGFIY